MSNLVPCSRSCPSFFAGSGPGLYGECIGAECVPDLMAGTEYPAPPGSGWWNPFPECPWFRIRVVGVVEAHILDEEVAP